MAMPPATVCTFVSSTWLDLQSERKAVEAALQRLRETKFVGMEYFGRRDENTHHASLDEVDRSQVYIGIFGGRYGSGITEAEYRRARERDLPCFIYFKDEANIPADRRETDPKQADQLAALKEELRRLHTIPTFTAPDDLAAKVTADLHRWLFDEYLASQLERAVRGDIPREEAQALLTAIKDLSALSQSLRARLREAGYVKAQGERSIAIGGDVTGSLIVTGDIVHIGEGHPRPLSPEERQKKLAEYRQRVVRENQFVNFRGIPLPRDRSGRPAPLRMPLDNVYIRLQATEEQRSRSQEEIERRRIEAQVHAQAEHRPPGPSIMEVLRMLGEYFYRRGDVYRATERPAPVDPADALQAHERLVILGAPGAGKSTLLRYLARHAAQDSDGPLPLLIRLRDYATALGKDQTLALREFALVEVSGGDEQLRRALEEGVETGHVLWLMDGLDEARGWRDKAAQQANRLPGRLIVTSRPVGYQRVDLESLPHFEILPLKPEDVDQFLRDWFGVLAEQQAFDPDWVEQRVSWLKLQLEQRPRIQPLTRNPLLLTFMVILAGKDPHSELPSQRAAFYRRYVEDLLDSWETYRRPQSGPEGEQAFRLGPFAGDHARLAAREGFYYLGWYLHLAYYGGHGEETWLNRRDVATALARYYKVYPACDLPPGDLHILAEDALEFWLEAGILDVWNIEGEEYLAFRHMTFQEYAASSMLAEAWKKTPPYTWAHMLRPILHHYAWREPLLLLTGLLDTRHRNDLVRGLLRGPSPYERYLHRDLRLAAALLAEDVALDTRLSRRIIDHLGWLIRNHTAVWKMRLTWLATYLVGGVAIWSPLLLSDMRLWGTLSSWWLYGGTLLWTMAWVCAFVNPVFPQIQTYLALPSRLWWGTHRPEPFIQALSDIGAPAVPAFIQALGASEEAVCQAAAQALGQLGDPQAIPPLIQALGAREDAVRQAAARALGRIGTPAIPSLIQALGASMFWVREAAARVLGNLADSVSDAQVTRRVADALRGRLTDWKDVREAASQALEQVANRLTILDVALHPIQDPLTPARITHSPGRKQFPWVTLLFMGLGFLDLLKGVLLLQNREVSRDT